MHLKTAEGISAVFLLLFLAEALMAASENFQVPGRQGARLAVHGD